MLGSAIIALSDGVGLWPPRANESIYAVLDFQPWMAVFIFSPANFILTPTP